MIFSQFNQFNSSLFIKCKWIALARNSVLVLVYFLFFWSKRFLVFLCVYVCMRSGIMWIFCWFIVVVAIHFGLWAFFARPQSYLPFIVHLFCFEISKHVLHPIFIGSKVRNGVFFSSLYSTDFTFSLFLFQARSVPLAWAKEHSILLSFQYALLFTQM